MIRFLIALLVSVNLAASDKYVAKTGSDSNPGTAGSPVLTVQKGVDLARAGDTVYVATGTYAENVRCADFAGSAGNLITVNGQNVATIQSITFEQPYIRVINFSFNPTGTIFGGKLYFAQIGSNCIFSNNVIDMAFTTTGNPVIKWNGPASAPFGAAGSDNLIISNVVKNVRDEMVFRIHGYRNIISGNQILNLDNTDYFQVAGGTNYIVNNLCSNLFLSGIWTNNHADFYQAFGDAGGSSQASMGNIVESNIVVKATDFAQLGNLTDDGYAYVKDLTFRNNVFIGISAKVSIAMPEVKFINNTFISCATNVDNGGAILIYADVGSIGHGHSGRCLNNAFLDCGIAGNTNNGNGWYSFDTTLTNCAADYNYVGKKIGGQYVGVYVDPTHRMVGAGGGWDKFAWWEDHGINGGDPKFVNESALDYRLLTGSPLIGAALSQASAFTVDIRGVTRGAAWDIGAYEFQQSDFNVYPCDVTPRLIQAYPLASSGATTIIVPANSYRTAIGIDRRVFTNKPSAWGVFTNIYTLSSASSSNQISFTDTNTTGVHLEYRVNQTIGTNQCCGDVNGYIDHQYIDTGYRAPLQDARGAVCLLVESGVNNAMPSDIALFISDLRGGGYKVYAHTNITAVEVSAGTTWTNAVWAVKQLISTDYNLDTTIPMNVIIVGHVPAPYSGLTLSPGSHADNIGAHGSDLFYADLNGTFTDTGTATSADATFTRNVSGDGKLDQDTIPSGPEVRIGRIDLGHSNMPAFSNTEAQRVQAYLQRNHNWRHKLFTVRNKAVIYYGGNTNLTVDAKPLEDNSRLAGYFGNTTSVDLGNWLTLGASTNTTYLFAAEQGAGEIDHSIQLGTSADFAATNFYAVFTATYGSYYGGWDSMNTNAFLKAVLGNGGYTLATWYHENYMPVNSSAMDEPIGYEQFAMQSQRFFIGTDKEYEWYKRIVPFTGTFLENQQHKMYESLMGDPTLLTRQVAPVSNLAVNASGSDNVLTWTASADASEGYHVYRAPTSDLNSFTRLTTNPTTSPYTNTGAAATAYVYMVRAVKLEDSVNRSFYAASQGMFVTSTAGGGGGGGAGATTGRITRRGVRR